MLESVNQCHDGNDVNYYSLVVGQESYYKSKSLINEMDRQGESHLGDRLATCGGVALL